MQMRSINALGKLLFSHLFISWIVDANGMHGMGVDDNIFKVFKIFPFHFFPQGTLYLISKLG